MESSGVNGGGHGQQNNPSNQMRSEPVVDQPYESHQQVRLQFSAAANGGAGGGNPPNPNMGQGMQMQNPLY